MAMSDFVIENGILMQYVGSGGAVTVPEGVVQISSEAFFGCFGLESIDLPDSLQSIGMLAFFGCSKLQLVDIPFGVRSIGESAFSCCAALETVFILATVEQIGFLAFHDTPSLRKIYCEAASRPYGWLDSWCDPHVEVVWGYNADTHMKPFANVAEPVFSPQVDSSPLAPFVFLSYSHRDRELLLPLFDALRDAGIPIWYDDGIRAGSEWETEIIENLERASAFLFFVSENSLNSINCRDELMQARDLGKPFINVLIEDIDLSKPEHKWFRFRYSRYQQVHAYSMSVDAVIEKLRIGLLG